VTRKPSGFSWQGFTPQQEELLDCLDYYGNNGAFEVNRDVVIM